MANYNRRLYVGIDVHSRVHKVALVPIKTLQNSVIGWKHVEYLDVESNIHDFMLLAETINKHVQHPEEAAIAVDHTGGHYSEPIISFLKSRGYPVYNLEPKSMKEAKERILGQENKSDITDAKSAAYLLYLGDIHNMSFRISAIPFELGTKASYLRWLIIEREQNNKRVVQVTNRLHQLLYAVFPEGQTKYCSTLLRICYLYPIPDDIIESENLKDVKYISPADRAAIINLASSTVGIPGRLYRDPIIYLAQQRAEATSRRDYLRQIIEQEVNVHPYGSVLLTFPHFGILAAAIVISITRDITLWSTKNKFKKALGVYSTLKQSGNSVGRGRMGKGGSRHARRALFQVVMRCIRTNSFDNDYKDYYERQVFKGKPKLKAMFSTMGKLAEVVYHCLKANESYQYTGEYRH